MPETLRLAWVLQGRPFEVRADLLTPEAVRNVRVARAHALRDLARAYDLAGQPAEFRDEVAREIRAAADAEAAKALLHGYLCAVDPALARLPADDVVGRLTRAEAEALGRALAADLRERDAPHADADAGAGSGAPDPLGRPASTS